MAKHAGELRQQLLPWLVLLVGLAITYRVWLDANATVRQELHSKFDLETGEVLRRIHDRMIVQEQALMSVRGLFSASASVERNEFQSFVGAMQLGNLYPGIQGIGYALVVQPKDKDKHVAEIRKQGFADYAIRPQGEREFYTSIVYLEPFDWRNKRAFGYDMYAEPIRHAAMMRARDGGAAVISGKVTLVQETDEKVQPGFLMYVPVYRNGMSHDTVAERRNSLLGWVYSPFRMYDLMQGTLGNFDRGLDIEIYDDGAASADDLLYDSVDPSPAHGVSAMFVSNTVVSVNGHEWTLRIRSLPAFESAGNWQKASIMRWVGVIFSLLLASLTWFLVHGRERALGIARQMNRELSESEQRFRSMANSAPVLIWVAGPDGQYGWINQVWLDFTGRTMQQETGSGWTEGVHPEDKDRCHAIYLSHFERREAFRMEYRLRRNDGEYRWMDDHGVPRFSGGGAFLGYIGSCTDITASKQMEIELQQTLDSLRGQSSRLQTILETASDGIHLLDEHGNVVQFSHSFARMLGYSHEEMAKLNVADWNAQWSKDQLMEGIRKLIDHPDTFEAVHRRKDGSIFDVEISAKGIALDGKYFLYAAARDITERKRAEERLRTLSVAIEQSPTSVVITDLDANIQYVNPQFTRVTGYTAEEAIGKNPRILQSGLTKHALYEDMWQTLTQGRVWHGELANHRKNGELYYEEAYLAPVLNADGHATHYVGVKFEITQRKELEKARRAAALYARSLIEASLDPLVTISPEGKITDVNKATEQVTGVAREQLIGSDFSDYCTAPQKARAGYRQVFSQGFVTDYPLAIRHVSGKVTDVLYNASVYRDEQGEVVGVFAAARDVTERKKAEESLQLAALVYESTSEAMAVTDADNHIIAINPAFTQLTGYTQDEVAGKTPRVLSSGRHDEAFYDAMWQVLESTGTWQGEVWNRRKNGEIYVEWLTINTIYQEDGSVHRRVALFSDITEKKKSEELIWQQANIDALTGLPNRRMVHDRLAQEIKKAHRAGLRLALMFLDLDRFKEVNDTLGHEMGDLLLKETAQRMVSCVRASDTVGRLGGDEFTIIVAGLDDITGVGRIANNILDRLAAPYQLGNEAAYISASIGITIYPDDAMDVTTLLKSADQAMYAAKRGGRSRFHYYTPAMQEAVDVRMRLTNDLHTALSQNQFKVYYQPIVNLTTGAVHKAEALIRWEHPRLGLVAPVDFIQIAEETRLIVDIGEWMFSQAAAEAARLQAIHYPDFQISINKSPVQFRNDVDNHSTWFGQLEKLGLSGRSIVVEITEGLLMDMTDEISRQLLAFRDYGMQVALDDFGTGYSSLAYLKKFDIDYLKIDQSFVHNLAPNSNDLVLCEAMIDMAHKLGIKVIAEGVETRDQRDLLKRMGCDYGQGYLFSQPLAEPEFEVFLSNSGALLSRLAE